MEGLFPPGAVLLGKYRIESVLGRGGMGMVVRVTHLHLGEELALKILSPEAAAGGPDAHARFLREAQASVRLRGEHVTRVSDVGVLPEGAPYIAMEYLRGVDLSGELARRGTLSPGDTVDYVLQACEALAEAHALGIVHRDIKPSNLFLTSRPDGTPLLKVLDFGISKAPVAGGALTRTDAVMGTPGYMSPEQMKAARDVDARTDIWALGIVLYECLSGRRPFDAETFSAIVLRAATEPPPAMDPRIPRALQAVVLRCLEKDRAARFSSMAALAAALAPFARDGRAAAIVVDRTTAMLQGPSGAAAPGARFGQRQSATTLGGSTGVVQSQSRRHWYAMVGTVFLVGAIAVVSAVSLTRSSPSSATEAASAVQDVGPAERETESAERETGSADHLVARQARVDAASATPATADEPPAVATTAGRTAVTEEPLPAKPDDGVEKDRDQKAARCAELEAQNDWRKLRRCASELAALGAEDKAKEFRATAVKRAASASAADKVQQALRDGNLREAEKQLKSIDSESAYFTRAGDAFRSAEASAVDEARRKAQALASAQDCAELDRLRAQLSTSSTSSVSAAAAAVTCVEHDQPAPTSNPGDPAAAKSPKAICEKMDAYDLWRQAANQYTAGFAKSALSLMVQALACKQDVTTYRLAATYACAAHDQESAKQYLAKVPPQFQGAIIQRCQQEGIDLLPSKGALRATAHGAARGSGPPR